MDLQKRKRDDHEALLTLWHQAQADDKDAFCQLAESQYRSLFRYGTNFSADHDVIKDAIQEVFLHIWERRATLTIQVVAVYLLQSLRNQLLGEFRRPEHKLGSLLNQEANDISDWQTVETSIEQHEADWENQQKVQHAITTLSKRQQEVVFLKFYKGLENEQIAEVMDMNRQSVANLLFRAICALKNRLLLQAWWLFWFLID